MTHRFHESLRLSEDHADAPWWREVYSEAFPDMVSTHCIRRDGWAQRGGIDRVILLRDGTALKIEQKVRGKVWPDFCLEYWSSFEHRTRGWIAKDLTCDFLAYAFIPNRTCYLLPWRLLRRAWRLNRRQWVKDHPRIEAVNDGYTTVSVAVPIREVLAAINDAMIIRWRGEQAA